MKSAVDDLIASMLSVIFLVACIGFAIGYWAASDRYEKPYCPSEDSCYADYRNGEWHIVER